MGQGGGLGGVPAHGGGEGVGGVDEGVHVVLTHPRGEPLGPAEPADAHLTGAAGGGDAPGERGGDPDAPVTGQALGQPARLGRTAQNKNTHGSRHRHRNGLIS
ncbi:hypothetical protein SCALM49S_04392 [Streptomyces californicus]